MEAKRDEEIPCTGSKGAMLNAQPLFAHQQQAFAELLSVARVLFDGRWRKLPISPRFNVLLIGPTGLGKTQIVRRVAEALSLPMFEVGTSNWMPLGTHHRGACPTWPSLFRFLIQNQRGIIFLDEVDKIAGRSEWSVFVRTEVFELLDRTLPRDIVDGDYDGDGYAKTPSLDSKTRRLAEGRLRRGILICAAGAFQELWEQSNSRPLGFAVANGDAITHVPAHDALSRALPRELVNRFRGRLLHLRPLNRGDYISMLEATASELPEELRIEFLRLGYRSIDSAIEGQLAVRWLEEVITQTLAKIVTVPRPHQLTMFELESGVGEQPVL